MKLKAVLCIGTLIAIMSLATEGKTGQIGDGGAYGGHWERTAESQNAAGDMEELYKRDPCLNPESAKSRANTPWKDIPRREETWIDGRTKDNRDSECYFAIMKKSKQPPAANEPKLLFVYLKGDGGTSSIRYGDIMRDMSNQFPGSIHVGITRQGECDGGEQEELNGRLYCSSGSNNGHGGDSFSERNVLSVAGAVENAKSVYGADVVIGVGHSGGSQNLLLASTMKHGLLNGAVLNGTPCNMHQWRQVIHRGEKTEWTRSLDADRLAPQADPKIRLTFTVGVKDDNTPRQLSELCEAAFKPYVVNTNIIVGPWGHVPESGNKERREEYYRLLESIIADTARQSIDAWKSSHPGHSFSVR